MGSFTVHADFNQLDGGDSLTKSVNISSNVQVIANGGVIYDSASHQLVDGVLQVQLPADDNEPGEFGYVIRRATGLTKVWRIPAQPPGTTVELTDFTPTTPLPLPASGNAASAVALAAEVAARTQGDLDALAAAKAYTDSHTGTGAVASVNAKTGAVILSAADVGAAPAADLAAETTRAQNAEATKVNASTYTAGIAAEAARADTASIVNALIFGG